jgi:hypothetical protein
LWRFVVAVCCGGLLWRFVVAVYCGGFLWRFLVAVCCGGLLWRFVVACAAAAAAAAAAAPARPRSARPRLSQPAPRLWRKIRHDKTRHVSSLARLIPALSRLSGFRTGKRNEHHLPLPRPSTCVLRDVYVSLRPGFGAHILPSTWPALGRLAGFRAGQRNERHLPLPRPSTCVLRDRHSARKMAADGLGVRPWPRPPECAL